MGGFICYAKPIMAKMLASPVSAVIILAALLPNLAFSSAMSSEKIEGIAAHGAATTENFGHPELHVQGGAPSPNTYEDIGQVKGPNAFGGGTVPSESDQPLTVSPLQKQMHVQSLPRKTGGEFGQQKSYIGPEEPSPPTIGSYPSVPPVPVIPGGYPSTGMLPYTPVYASPPPIPTYGTTPPIPTYGTTPSVPSYPSGGGTTMPTYGAPSPGPGSCSFWSSNPASWPNILSTISKISSAFGMPASPMWGGDMTLLQALQNTRNDAYGSLLRQATASLLNSYSYKKFPFTPQDVKTKFEAALASPMAAAAQAEQFAQANEKHI